VSVSKDDIMEDRKKKIGEKYIFENKKYYDIIFVIVGLY
jgi:hypothetical protein